MIRIVHLLRPAEGGMERQVRLLAGLQPGAEVLSLPLDPHLSPLSDLRLALGLRRRFPGRGELVHAHGLKAAWVLALARPRVPAVWTCHGWPAAEGAAALLARLALKRCLEAFPCIAVSPLLARRLMRLSGKARVFLVPNGLPEESFRPPPPPGEAAEALGLRLPEGEPVPLFFSFVGRLTREKGVDLFLQAADSVLSAEPGAAALVAGSGPEAEAVRRAALRWQGRLFFLGFREDVRPVLSLSRLLLLPARREGFGLASLEARAAGVPVVAARGPGVNLPPVPEEAGVLALPPDPGEMARAVVRLLRDDRERKALAEKGRRHARSFTLSRQVRETEAVYREVWSAGGGRAVRGGESGAGRAIPD